MKFTILHKCAEYYFSLGVEEESKKYFISIPVGNEMVDYSEYYEVENSIVDNFPSNFELVKKIADECRDHKRDSLLFLKPGTSRGVPHRP